MPGRQEEFARLLEEIRDGNQSAAHEFIEKFGRYILKAIRHRLETRLRTKFDSCDFMQDVFASFFHKPPPPESFISKGALLAYLLTLARHKVGEVTRDRMVLQHHNINRERSLDGSAKYEALRLEAPGPSPSEVVVANETWDVLVQPEPTKISKHELLLQMLVDGKSNIEIAARLGLSVKTVQRLKNKLQMRLES